MLRALPDLVYSDERLVIEENHVALFLTASGTHEGAFLGYPASGHSVVVECAALFTVSEAGIERELRCFDFTGLLVQLGVLKAKPA